MLEFYVQLIYRIYSSFFGAHGRLEKDPKTQPGRIAVLLLSVYFARLGVPMPKKVGMSPAGLEPGTSRLLARGSAN